jgi:anti-sigma factor ChrR (cupin superfamily)
MSELRDLLTPVSALLAELNLDDPAAVEAALVERFPPDGEAFATIAAAARAALAAGTICDRGEAPVRFSRIAKPEEDPHGFSVDAVLLERTAGPRHTHPRGEISLCLVEEGEPTFEGRKNPTWVAMAPGSSHVPTSEGGSILFLYWWPGGEVVWE